MTALFSADAIKKTKELQDQTRTIAGMGQNRRYDSFREGYGGGYGYNHGGKRGRQFQGRRCYHGYQRNRSKGRETQMKDQKCVSK